MKTKLLSVFLAVILLALVSFSDPYTIKRISDDNFRYEFYTTAKVTQPKNQKTYYWFKGGAIHKSESGMAGELLDGKYSKMFLSNQLAEQGEFTNGLKSGVWKTWYPNGTLETRQYWSNGFKKDTFLHYDSNGQLIEKGNYRSDRKHGKWIDLIKKDTVIYKSGNVFVKKPKLTKEEKIKFKEEKARLKEEKKKNAAIEKATEKIKKSEKASQKAAKKNKKDQTQENTDPAAQPQKKSFFKRLFSKKPKVNTDGQSQ